MTKVFIGGSREVSRLNPQVQERLDRIIEKHLPVLVGDANGADKAVQQYLHSKGYPTVEIFCAGNFCRNNVGNWKLRMVASGTRARTFDFYAAKDRQMTQEANFGFMIWDAKSIGTLLNVFRLLRQQKKVVVYNVPERKFLELKNQSDWEVFVSNCGAELKSRLQERAALEDRTREYNSQSSLLT